MHLAVTYQSSILPHARSPLSNVCQVRAPQDLRIGIETELSQSSHHCRRRHHQMLRLLHPPQRMQIQSSSASHCLLHNTDPQLFLHILERPRESMYYYHESIAMITPSIQPISFLPISYLTHSEFHFAVSDFYSPVRPPRVSIPHKIQ